MNEPASATATVAVTPVLAPAASGRGAQAMLVPCNAQPRPLLATAVTVTPAGSVQLNAASGTASPVVFVTVAVSSVEPPAVMVVGDAISRTSRSAVGSTAKFTLALLLVATGSTVDADRAVASSSAAPPRAPRTARRRVWLCPALSAVALQLSAPPLTVQPSEFASTLTRLRPGGNVSEKLASVTGSPAT